MQTDDKKPRSDAYRKYLKYSQVGIQFFVAIGLCTFAGIWLDGKLGTVVLFTLLGLFFGFGAGFYGLYLDLYGRKRKPGKAESGHEEAREKNGSEAEGGS